MHPSYHHGDLRRAVIDEALRIISSSGPEQLSLRAIAAAIGVSHTAPRHHFGSRDGLLTAIATEGFDGLADALIATREGGGTFLDVGVSYVGYGTSHPAHFAVMFAPDLLLEDPELARASGRAFGELRSGVEALGADGRVEDAHAAVVAGWSLVHGLTTLALTGNLERANLTGGRPAPELLDLVRRAAGMLYGSPG
ncbi:TetR/AcrR family transcriptional regulator [Georgenia sp. Z1491]|uniref:TetR/AcrR family transcriptional regulator n=1 Tax=Georgenia sp. Z1491 TaxID=3416707 RepID=UPI003CE6C4A5